MHAPSNNTHTHTVRQQTNTKNIRICMDLLYSTLSHSQFANPWVTLAIVHVSSIYVSTIWILDRSSVNSSLSHWPEVLACATNHHGWGGRDACGQFMGSPNLCFQTYDADSIFSWSDGDCSRNVQNHCPHKNIHLYRIVQYKVYCLMFSEYHVNVYKLPWGKSFFGFLTMIHPDRHATDRGKYFFSNQTFQPMVLVVKSC